MSDDWKNDRAEMEMRESGKEIMKKAAQKQKDDFVNMLKEKNPNVDIESALECFQEVMDDFSKDNPGVVNPSLPLGSDLSKVMAIKMLSKYLEKSK
jgi:hypothetical protein